MDQSTIADDHFAYCYDKPRKTDVSVWLLLDGWEDRSFVCGIFTSREAAENALRNLKSVWPNSTYPSVAEYPLNQIKVEEI